MGVTPGWTRYYRGQREFGGHNDMREVTELKAAKTMADLMLLIVVAWYGRSITPEKKAAIIRAGQKYGLIDADGRKTPKYFALVNDDVEKLCRELMGTKQAKACVYAVAGKRHATAGSTPPWNA
jgi:hypothetical protein